MFTKEGSATTPVVSAVSTSLIVGVVSGVFFWFRISEGWGITAGVLMTGVFFFTIYPKLREERAKQERLPPGQSVIKPPLRERLASTRPHLIRIAILFAALPVGFVLSLAMGSVWGLVVAMLAAFVLLVGMRYIGGRIQ